MKYKSNTKIFLIIAAIAMSLGLSSCEDFYEQEAGNRIRPELHYRTQIDLISSYRGVILPLQEAMPKLVIADGLLSDQMTVTNNTDIDIKAINEHKYSFNNEYLNTSGFYKVIINANEVISNMYKFGEIDPNFDDYYQNQYTTALVAMRSLAYFTLARINGEVAYIPDNLTAIPDEGLLYISKEAMLDTLISQLTPYLHIDSEFEELWIGGFPNAKALIGEIYLEKDDYENAAYYLKAGLESYGNENDVFKVDKTYQRVKWFNIFFDSENQMTEVICATPFKYNDGQLNPVTGYTLPGDKYLVKPTKIIVDLFANQEGGSGKMGDATRGIGVSIDTTSSGEYFVNKYNINTAEPYSSDIIVTRAGDLHLQLAEALNRMGDHDRALALLNFGFSEASSAVRSGYTRWTKNVGIRGRASLAVKNVPSDVANKVEFIEDLIIEERALELAFEGKRYMDLIRIAERRGDADYLARRVSNKFDDAAKRKEVKELLWGQENWFIPLNK